MNSSATHKSTTIELTVDPSYVPDWGVWEAVRELLQNAIDAHEQGYPMTVVRGRGATKAIRITNQGADLGRDTLLLGRTSKRDDDSQRGKFGEGYKLALTVLARLDKAVTARTRTETWTPVIDHSSAFGTDVLKVKIRPAKQADRVSFEVHGVSDDDWALIQDRCLFINAPANVVDTWAGRILLDPAYRGKLFAGGIYVCDLPDQLGFGYDLKHLSLDRDRKLAEPWSLRWELSRVLRAAFESDNISVETIMSMLAGDGIEAAALKEHYESSFRDSDKLAKQAAAAFRSEHGERAVPVSSTQESIQAAQVGLKGVIVPPAVRAVLEKEVGAYVETEARQRMTVKRYFGADDLEPKVQADLEWAVALVGCVVDIDEVQVNVVEFFGGDDPRATYQVIDGVETINMNIATMKGDKGAMLGTFVHEVAHRYGGDGTAEHRVAIQNIFGTIVAGLID